MKLLMPNQRVSFLGSFEIEKEAFNRELRGEPARRVARIRGLLEQIENTAAQCRDEIEQLPDSVKIIIEPNYTAWRPDNQYPCARIKIAEGDLRTDDTLKRWAIEPPAFFVRRILRSAQRICKQLNLPLKEKPAKSLED